jgi:hypothetical protein
VSSSPAQLFQRATSCHNYFISAAKANGSKYETSDSSLVQGFAGVPEQFAASVIMVSISTHRNPLTWELQFSRSILSIPDCELGDVDVQYVQHRYSELYLLFCMGFEFCLAECMQIMRAIHDPSYWPPPITAAGFTFATGLSAG